MNTTNNPTKDFIKSLQIIHFALLGVLVAFAVYIAFITKDRMFFSYEENKPFLYLAIIISFAGNLTSKFLFSRLISQIESGASINQKIVKYSTAHIFRMAMLEFPAFMCLFFILESNNSFYFILVGILAIMMLAIYPNRNKFMADVPLTNKEKSMIEKL